MAKKKMSVNLEKGDVDTVMAFGRAKKKNIGFSAACRDIIREKILREKILSGAVDMFSKASMLEQRVDAYLKDFARFKKRIDKSLDDFERLLKKMALNYKK